MNRFLKIMFIAVTDKRGLWFRFQNVCAPHIKREIL